MASPVPFPWDAPRLWDSFTIAGALAPGIVIKFDPDVDFKADEKNAQGNAGAFITIAGRKLQSFSVKLKLWTRKHNERVPAFKALLTTGDLAGKPFDCTHPVLVEAGVRSIVILSIKGPGMPDADGYRYIDLDLREFVAKPKAVGTSTAKSATATAPVLTQYAIEDAKRAAMVEEIRKLKRDGYDATELERRVSSLDAAIAKRPIGPPTPKQPTAPKVPPP
jgi:hypothetical protein